MKRNLTFAILVGLLAVPAAMAEEKQPEVITREWGKFVPQTGEVYPSSKLIVTHLPKDGRVELEGATRITTAAILQTRDGQHHYRWLDVEYTNDAKKTFIHVPAGEKEKARPATESSLIVINHPDKSQQYPRGTIAFLAGDAKIHGKTARLESTNGHDRIGFWSDANDYVTWDYTATRPGMYELILTYATSVGDAEKASEVAVSLGDQTLNVTLDNTGSWYRYRTLTAGKIHIPAPGKHTLTVKGTKKVGGAVMNLKAITLRTTSEGNPIKQADDGSITMHARDVIIRGVKVQWEPRPAKQTVGYWVNENDHVSWKFEATKTGQFEVEILQGCGKGQGGSTVGVLVDKPGSPLHWSSFEFVVEDTGHFQNFKARIIGTIEIAQPGGQELTLIPFKKAKNAVMDVRQVRLIPVKE